MSERTVLDWPERSHWVGGWDFKWSHPKGQQGLAYHAAWIGDRDRRPKCRYCGNPTFLKEEEGPAHKVCVEAWIDRRRE